MIPTAFRRVKIARRFRGRFFTGGLQARSALQMLSQSLGSGPHGLDTDGRVHLIEKYMANRPYYILVNTRTRNTYLPLKGVGKPSILTLKAIIFFPPNRDLLRWFWILDTWIPPHQKSLKLKSTCQQLRSVTGRKKATKD